MQQLIKRRESLLARLVAGGDFIKGSITCVCGTCGRARCICKMKSPSKAYRLTYKDGRQKTQIVYIPRNRLPEMKRLTANYARVRELVQKIITTNIAIFKKGGLPVA
jgi:intergrase/recombinase